MRLDIRAATPQERLYLDNQSCQLEGQTGYIGVLNGSFEDSQGAYSTEWTDSGRPFHTETFDEDFDSLVNALRFDDANAHLLQGRNAARLFCREKPDSAFMGKNGQEYAFRIDYRGICCLIRLAPLLAGQNFQIRCYVQDWLDKHMERARQGIRFITPEYKEVFRIPDGDAVRAFDEYGSADCVCRFIDETHLEVSRGRSTTLYHICELAERLQRAGRTVIPLRSSLPECCYGVLASTGETILIQKGQKGYSHANLQGVGRMDAKALVDKYNQNLGISKAQASAMLAGAVLGWEVPAADPKRYDANGVPHKARRSGYSMER